MNLDEILAQTLEDMKDYKAMKANPIAMYIHDLKDQIIHKEANVSWFKKRDERLKEIEASLARVYP